MSELQKTNQQGISKPRCAEDRLDAKGAAKSRRTEKPKKYPGCDKEEEKWEKVIRAQGVALPILRREDLKLSTRKRNRKRKITGPNRGRSSGRNDPPQFLFMAPDLTSESFFAFEATCLGLSPEIVTTMVPIDRQEYVNPVHRSLPNHEVA